MIFLSMAGHVLYMQIIRGSKSVCKYYFLKQFYYTKKSSSLSLLMKKGSHSIVVLHNLKLIFQFVFAGVLGIISSQKKDSCTVRN